MNKEGQIIHAFENNKNIKRYRELESIINNNESINSKMNELKEIQKQIVHAKSFSKDEALKKLENNYEMLYNEFLEIPLISEYLTLQSLINDLLQNFTNIIEENLKNDLED